MNPVSQDPTWTDVAGVALVAAQLVVLVVAALVATRQVAEAKRLREEKARPFVVVDLDVQRHVIFFVIANLGSTLARNVRLKISPPLDSAIDVSLAKLKMLTDGIPNLAPGKEYRTVLDSFIQREAAGVFPDAYTVSISYEDETGRRPFSEEHVLDIGLYRNLMHVTDDDVRDIKKSLDKIQKEMKKWTAGTRGGLLRLSPDERDERNERLNRELEERPAALRRPRENPDAPEGA